MKSARQLVVFVLFAIGISGGCASIVSGRYADVHLDSHPPNAHVVIRDHKGAEVTSANTPAVVSLRRSRRFFLPARYTATFEAPGHESATVPIRSTVNPWVLGNVVLGGVVGLAVDTGTGAGWKPRHDQITQHLQPIYTAEAPSPPTAQTTPRPDNEIAAASGTY